MGKATKVGITVGLVGAMWLMVRLIAAAGFQIGAKYFPVDALALMGLGFGIVAVTTIYEMWTTK